MNTMKIFITIVLMAVSAGQASALLGGAEVVEGQTSTIDEYDAEAAGDWKDTTAIPAEASLWGDLNNLRNLTLQSDLVFHGVVTDVSYRLSEPSGPEGLQVPFTFITYWVDQVILGTSVGDYVTLRFIGGLDERTGDYMTTSISPEIEFGDEDILFVKDNNWSFSPLVGNYRGRLRIIGDQVYNESGREVTLNHGDRMILGPRHLFPEVVENNVYTSSGLLTFEKAFGSGVVDSRSDAVSPDTIIDRIVSFGLQPADGTSFVNADINAFLPGPDMTEAPEETGATEEQPLDPEQKTDQEFEELEELAVAAGSVR